MARQSRVLVRCYEKGKQLLAQRRVGEATPSLDHCRLEVEVKPPNKAAKMLGSKLSPVEFLGCSAGSCEILSRASALDVERVCMTAPKESDPRRAIRHMEVQYRLSMETVIAEEMGDDSGLFRFIRGVWKGMDAERRSAQAISLFG
jgi:hypothetical protein